MNEKESGSFRAETPKVPLKRVNEAVPRSGGGRPRGAFNKHGAESTFARAALDLYVSHIRMSAPPGWTENQLNLALFEDPLPLSAIEKREPTYGLRDLSRRLSIPSLEPSTRLSLALLRAETDPRYSGGLQILYHPYLRLLMWPAATRYVYELLSFCRSPVEIGLFRQTAYGRARSMRAPVEEQRAFDDAVDVSRSDRVEWKARFLDLLAPAIAMLLEADQLGDVERLTSWKAWFKTTALRFENWPVGDPKLRARFQAFVDRLVRLTRASIEPDRNVLSYMAKRVYHRGGMGEVWMLRETPRIGSPTYEELTWTYLAIRNARPPTDIEIAEVLRRHRGFTRNTGPDSSDCHQD